MILHPLPPAAAQSGTAPIRAWDAIFPTQRQPADGYLLIAQDDHAQLAGELAAAFRRGWLTQLNDEIVDAIRRHDCGWRALDEELLERARRGAAPVSFLDMSVPEFLTAWTGSIEQVAATSPLGGAVVSLHFSRLAEYRLSLRQDTADDTRRLGGFVEAETARRRRLVAPCGASPVPFFTDALQLCDLVSLYLCCGSVASVQFPQFEGQLTVRREGETLLFSTALCAPLELSLATTAWPREKAAENPRLRFRLETAARRSTTITR